MKRLALALCMLCFPLFAQELKTPVPVSVKRLSKLWETLRR